MRLSISSSNSQFSLEIFGSSLTSKLIKFLSAITLGLSKMAAMKIAVLIAFVSAFSNALPNSYYGTGGIYGYGAYGYPGLPGSWQPG